MPKTKHNPLIAGSAAAAAHARGLGGNGLLMYDTETQTEIPLLNVSLEHRSPNQFIAGEIFPDLTMPRQLHTIFGIDPNDNRLRRKQTKRAPGSPAERLQRTFNRPISLKAQDYAIADVLTDEEREDPDQAIASEIDMIGDLTEALLLDKEITARDLVVSTVTGGGYAADPGTNWAGGTGSPRSDIKGWCETIRARTNMLPNRIALDYSVYAELRIHPDFLETINPSAMPADYDESRQMGAWLLGQGVPDARVVVANSFVNSAGEGLTASNASVWGENVLLYHHQEPRLRMKGFGVCGKVDSLVRNATAREGMALQLFRDEEASADVRVLHMNYNLAVTNLACAFRATNVLSAS